jgi:3',5'-cyclic AMP phosphodiesterase CpdA
VRRRHLLWLAGGVGITAVAARQLQANTRRNVLPPAANNPLWRFVSVADTGSGTRNQYAVANAMAAYHQRYPFELVALGGDNIYTNGEMEKIGAVFERPYSELLKKGVKFYAALGNHDVRTNNGDGQIAYRPFHLNGRYHTFTRSPVQFFVLDTNQLLGRDTAERDRQIKWFVDELTKSRSPWKVVYGHHQIYSGGQYGNNPQLISLLTPIFKKYRVQLWLNGHDHNYQRSQPLDGTTYLVTGGGGASLYPLTQQSWHAYAESLYSFAAIDVENDRLTIHGIDTQGNTFDRGTVLL